MLIITKFTPHTSNLHDYWSVYRNFVGISRDSEIAPTEHPSL